MSTPGATANQQLNIVHTTQLTKTSNSVLLQNRIESRNQFDTLYTSRISFVTIEDSMSVVWLAFFFAGSDEVVALQANSTRDNTVTISWQHPANPNGHILNYSVIIIDLSDGSTVRQETAVSTSVYQTDLGEHRSVALALQCYKLRESTL